MRAKLDKILNSWISKKLSVFIVATVLASTGYLSGTEWCNVALVYISAQSAVDIVMRLRNNNN